jgi:hypothetical protein
VKCYEKYGKKSRLNCEMIWKIWKKSKLNSGKIPYLFTIQLRFLPYFSSFHYSTCHSSILPISYHYSTCLSSIFSISFHNFLLYLLYLITIQLGFLPYWKIWKKSNLKCEMIYEIWKKSKLKCDKIWTIWKNGKLNSETIWKIWKKNLLFFRIVHTLSLFDLHSSIFFISFHNFLLYFPNLFTIQLTFLPHCPYLITINDMENMEGK